MRKLHFLLVIAGMALPACAARRVSVAELEQLLVATHGQQDKKVAKQIDDLVLTERVSYTRLAKWESEFPDPLSREALIKIADGSAFEGAAPEDVPNTPKPDRDAQIQMLKKAMDYTADTLHRLPNFTATRRTTSFETVPHIKGDAPPAVANAENVDNDFGQLFSAGSWSVPVTYRDGAEVVDSGANKTNAKDVGLSSKGEFGPILNVVLSDALQGRLLWSHWERGANGDYGVFSYTVPQEHSHYTVGLSSQGDSSDTANLEYRENNNFLRRTKSMNPAYHGEIGIDPAMGSIMRISMEADFGPRAVTSAGSIQVEFGAVEIGGSSYICPVRSVALSRFQSDERSGVYAALTDKSPDRVITQLNDVVFTDYHVFRSESRILPVASTDSNNGTPGGAGPVPEPTHEQK